MLRIAAGASRGRPGVAALSKIQIGGVVGLVDAGRNHSVFRQSLCAESDGDAGAWCDHAIGRRGIPERMGDACLWSLVRKMSHAVL